MKYLIIGQPRSRSNYLLDAVSQHEGVTNLQEPYSTAIDYHAVLEIRDQLKSQDHIAVKIQWNHLEINNRLLTPSELGIGNYDHVFWTYRENLVHAAASKVLARRFNMWAYWREDNIDPVEPFKLDINQHELSLNGVAYQAVLASKFRQQLDSSHISYTALEYNDVIEYTSTHYPTLHSLYKNTERNFDQLVINSDQAAEWIQEKIKYYTTLV